MIQTILPRAVRCLRREIFSHLSTLTWFLRLYFVISRGRLYRIKVIENCLQLLLLYLPEGGDTQAPFYSRLPALVIEDTEADKLASLLLFSSGFISQVAEAEAQFDVVGLHSPRLLLQLRSS